MDDLTKASLETSRKRASRVRGTHLMAVASQMMTCDDVLDAYRTTPELGRIRLDQLLAAQPGFSMARARRVVEKFRHMARLRWADPTGGHSKVPERPTISYVCHGQSTVLRELWGRAQRPARIPPWPGFPHAPKPADQPSAATDRSGADDDFGF